MDAAARAGHATQGGAALPDADDDVSSADDDVTEVRLFDDGWISADYTQLPFVRWLLQRNERGERIHTFDAVVSNPDFDVGMQTLLLGLLALAPQRADRSDVPLMFALLPSDFFEGSEERMRLYRMLNLSIVAEYKVGHQAYYTGTTQEKRTCDSLFVLRRNAAPQSVVVDIEQNFSHMVYDVRLAGIV